MELQNVKLNNFEWSIVRQSILGTDKKPRRFSQAFIEEERQRLNTYRDIFREIMKSMQNKNFEIDANGEISML